MRLGWDQVSQACKISTSIAKLPSWDTCKIFIWCNWNPMYIDRSGDFLCVDCNMQGRLTVATPQYLRMFASQAEKSMGHWAAAPRNWVQHPTSTHQPKPEVLWEGSLWPLVWWGKDNETAWKKLSPIEGFDSVVCFSPRQSDVLVVRPKSKLQLERFWLVRLVGLLLRYLMQRSFMPLSHDLESSAWDLSHQRLPTGTVGLSSISASAPRLFASLCASLYSHGSQGRRMKHDDQPLVAVKSCHEWSMFFFPTLSFEEDCGGAAEVDDLFLGAI